MSVPRMAARLVGMPRPYFSVQANTLAPVSRAGRLVCLLRIVTSWTVTRRPAHQPF